MALHIQVVSFGFKYGVPSPPPQASQTLQLDCRGLPNPYWDEALRAFCGLDAPIDAFMQQHPPVLDFAQSVWKQVTTALSQISPTTTSSPSLFVALGCTGGRHRSVWQAAKLAKALSQQGHQVSLKHLHLNNDAHSVAETPPAL